MYKKSGKAFPVPAPSMQCIYAKHPLILSGWLFQYDLVLSAYSMLELPSSEARLAEINSLWARYVFLSGLQIWIWFGSGKPKSNRTERFWNIGFYAFLSLRSTRSRLSLVLGQATVNAHRTAVCKIFKKSM
jgi:hypothetical protein